MTAQLGLNYFGGNLFAQPFIVYTSADTVGLTDSVDRAYYINIFLVDNETISDLVNYSGLYTAEVPKLLKSLEFKPIGQVIDEKSKTNVIVVSKPQGFSDNSTPKVNTSINLQPKGGRKYT